MRAYVSPTDGRWAAFLRARPYLDEVNFWWPSGIGFKALQPGERFLFKAKARDGGLEVEFEVDSNRNGRTWSYTLRHDGRLVATGRRVTQAPSGSFSVTRRMVDAPGTHRITATAKNLRTGEVCRAAMTA